MVGTKTRIAAAVLTVAMTASTMAQTVPAPPSPPTVWSFLGIPQGMKKVKGALTNRRGNHPAVEPKDALKALNDPANLESPDPAIKRAAEIKKAEDLKPQKIKAIKYLTSIGCGCYDKDGSVTDALVASAEDCTEDVRLLTMNEIKAAACGKSCSNCGQSCCCNDKMLKKLAQIAYERDEFGCYGEPSKRVREAAAAALQACCPGSPPLDILKKEPEPEPTPEVVPEREKVEGDLIPERERNLRDDGGLEQLDALEARRLAPVVQISTLLEQEAAEQSSRNFRVRRSAPSPVPSAVPEGIARMRYLMSVSPPLTTATPNPGGGVVLAYDAARTVAYVHFQEEDSVIPVGSVLHLRPDPSVADGFNGMWRVIESAAGCANLEPTGAEGIENIRVGDHADFGNAPVVISPVSYFEE
ncbi:hypothetical protein [Aureliella helgolandensis]|uniref:Uncharacterized protein n=1 Tax=Aureliella helgolandensis TaxID=2527968 RepID=A0A518GAC8_9BACT|nr:hypothetical protein [Aureliella helgolandensis]QDV25558.1 hypothetical protein Q31a_38840 [Aureliella helgolandensis]